VGLFDMLDGVPAHALVIIGLALALLVPMIQAIKEAGRKGALAEIEQGQKLIDLEVLRFKDEKAKEGDVRAKKATAEQEKSSADRDLESARQALTRLRDRQSSPAPSPDFSTGMTLPQPPTPEEIRKAEDDVKAAERKVDRTKAEVEKAEGELKQVMDQVTDTRTEEEVRRQARDEYKLADRHKAFHEAEISAQGAVLPPIIGWLGRLMLILGLLVLTVQSTGLRQKILLFVLLIVMLSALSGFNLLFATQGNIGEQQRQSERLTPPPLPTSQETPSPSSPFPNPNRPSFPSPNR
jgi:DNA repair exonuclease SbcCD ATPase subunit